MRPDEQELNGVSDKASAAVQKLKQQRNKPSVHTITSKIPPPSHKYEPIVYAPRHAVAHVPEACIAPIDYFRLYITENHTQLIAKYTNYNAIQHICGQALRSAPRNKPRSRLWHGTCASEIDVFIGILLAMGLTRLPRTEDYWNEHTNVEKHDEIRRVSKRYSMVLSFLSINC